MSCGDKNPIIGFICVPTEPGELRHVQEYGFEITIVAVVRVRAESESVAREVLNSSALASPSTDDIRLANQAEFVRGTAATVVSVDFSLEEIPSSSLKSTSANNSEAFCALRG